MWCGFPRPVSAPGRAADGLGIIDRGRSCSAVTQARLLGALSVRVTVFGRTAAAASGSDSGPSPGRARRLGVCQCHRSRARAGLSGLSPRLSEAPSRLKGKMLASHLLIQIIAARAGVSLALRHCRGGARSLAGPGIADQTGIYFMSLRPCRNALHRTAVAMQSPAASGRPQNLPGGQNILRDSDDDFHGSLRPGPCRRPRL